MRILFTSDVHGDMQIYKAFAEKLGSYDCGIIAGDLMEEFLPIDDANEFGLLDDDLIEELHGDEYDEIQELEKALFIALHNPESINRKGLEIKRQKIVGILESASKPVFYVTGNHDIACWETTQYFINIENKKVEIGSYSIFGLKDTFRLAKSKFRYSSKVASHIDSNTILVSHSPPYGVLDVTKTVRRRDHRLVTTHIGNKKIRKLIEKRHPKYCLFGHVHEGLGNTGNMINGGCYRHNIFVSINTDRMYIHAMRAMENIS
jgi:Icc-related predicted phosphoesterase